MTDELSAGSGLPQVTDLRSGVWSEIAGEMSAVRGWSFVRRVTPGGGECLENGLLSGHA
jgi:hypothetical protein